MKTRLEDFRLLKTRGRKIAALTAYDYPAARLLDNSDVDVILVGDSLGMVVLGYPDTTHVTMDEMIHHCRAVTRGATRTLLVGDLPAHSYDSADQAIENARRLIEAGMHAVKLEGGASHADRIRAMVSAGIPVMAHIGMLPQSLKIEGGYRVKGRSETEAAALVVDALAVESAGAFSVVLEVIAPAAAARITREIAIPTIGIGSGHDCDGQVLVLHDLVGLFPWFTPKFVSPRVDVAGVIRKAVDEFVTEVRSDDVMGPA